MDGPYPITETQLPVDGQPQDNPQEPPYGVPPQHPGNPFGGDRVPPRPPPQPPPQLPWSQTDTISLSRQQQALQQIENDLAKGAITASVAQQAQQQITPRYQALLQKQQQHSQQMLSQQIQQAMQGAAMQESILGIHKQKRAQNFSQEIATLADPITGHHAYFTQDEKGNWDEVKFDHSHTETQDALVPVNGDAESSLVGGQRGAGGNRSGGLPDESEGSGLGQPLSGSEQPAQNLASAPQPVQTLAQLGEQMRGGGVVSGETTGQQVDPRTFEQTIISGGNTTRYRGGREVGSDRPQPATPGKDGISEQQLKGVWDLVRRTMPSLSPHAGPHERLAYMEAQHKMAHSIMGRLEMTERHRQEQEAKGLEASRQLREKSTLARQDAEHKAALQRQEFEHKRELLRAEKQEMGPAALSPKEHSDLVKNYVAEARKARDKWQADEDKRTAQQKKDQKDVPAGEVKTITSRVMPEWMRTEDGIFKKGMADYDRHVAGLEAKRSGKKVESGDAQDHGEPAADSSANSSSVPDKVPIGHQDRSSSIGVERVREILPFAKNALEGAQRIKTGNKGADPRNITGTLAKMHDILDEAHQQGRPLTIQQRKDYEDLHLALQGHLRDEGAKPGEWEAPWLRLAEPGGKQTKLPPVPGTAGAGPAAEPERGLISEERYQNLHRRLQAHIPFEPVPSGKAGQRARALELLGRGRQNLASLDEQERGELDRGLGLIGETLLRPQQKSRGQLTEKLRNATLWSLTSAKAQLRQRGLQLLSRRPDSLNDAERSELNRALALIGESVED